LPPARRCVATATQVLDRSNEHFGQMAELMTNQRPDVASAAAARG
jgi:hypothetical protein